MANAYDDYREGTPSLFFSRAIPLLLAGLLVLSMFGSAGATQVTPGSRPNIVLIFIDDLGYGDIGPYGSTKNRTPHLDRMAREGMKLTSFYAAPVCSVSRAQVMTGCYGVRVSIPGVFFPADRHGINADEHTVAELLKDQGYATMCIGKWHLGDQPPFLPTRHGFDHYFGIPYSNDMNKPAASTGQPVVPLLRDEKVVDLLDGTEQNGVTARYTEEAVKFIRDHQEKPFFLYFPHTAVHTPLHPGDNFRGKSANGNFGDWVEEVDWSVGRVLDSIRESKLSERTLVIFTSDNGPWLTQGKNGGEAGPLRGGKGSTWEGGMREPTIAWWPGKIAPGSSCDAVAGNIDFLPTFVSLAGGKVPTDRKIDGRDFSPLLLGTSKQSQREAHYYYHGNKLEAVRSGPWKLALGPQGEGRGKNGDAPDAIASGVRLYNLDEEIGERTNLAAQHPEIVSQLQKLADAMAAELGNGKPGPACRPAGEVDQPTLLYVGKVTEQSTTSVKPVDLQKLKLGETLDASSAPQIANRPFTIICDVQPEGQNGVIVAHGGKSFGYSLALVQGQLWFSVRTRADSIATVKSDRIPEGRIEIEAELAKDGAMTLMINGKPVAKGQSPGLISRQPQENFCVGHDDANAVNDESGTARFKGTLGKLLVKTNDVN